jgi:hypothetical protein
MSMSETNVNTTSGADARTLGQRLDRLTRLMQERAGRRPGFTRYAAVALVAAALAGAGYEGYRYVHGAGPAEVKPTTAAVESVKPDEVVKTTMRIEGVYVTSGGLVLCNSKRNFRDADNVVLVLPAGAATRETKSQLVGKTFTGEVTKGSYQGKAQLIAVAGRYELK